MNKLQLIGLGIAVVALVVSGFSFFVTFRLAASVDDNRNNILEVVNFINNAIQQTPPADE